MRNPAVNLSTLIGAILLIAGTATAGPLAAAPQNCPPPTRARFASHSLCVPYNDHQKMEICAHRPVPPGWVIVGERYSPNCTGCGRNTLIIQRLTTHLAPEMLICKGQPVPEGWGIIGEERNKHCSGHGANMWRIRRL